MAYTEEVMEREAYMADTETENMQLREDNELLKKKLEDAETLLEITTEVLGGNVSLFQKRYKKAQAEADQLSELWRYHLDECDPQDDDDYEDQARQILCDAPDIEKQIAADGYDKTDAEYIPF